MCALRATVIAVAVLLALLAPLASAQPLGAALDRAVVLWQGSAVLYKNYDPAANAVSEQRVVVIPIERDTVQQLLDAYPSAGYFYVILEFSSIDPYDDSIPAVHIYLRIVNQAIYGSGWHNPVGGELIFPVERLFLETIASSPATPNIHVSIINLNVPSPAGDNSYSLELSRILLAPPEYTPQEQPAGEQEQQEQPGFTAALLGFSVAALALAIIMAARRR